MESVELATFENDKRFYWSVYFAKDELLLLSNCISYFILELTVTGLN